MGGYNVPGSMFGTSIDDYFSKNPQQPGADAMPQAQTPQAQAPANASAAPVKTGLRHALMQMLGSFTYGGGQAMMKAAGLPTDQEMAMQNASMAHVNAQTKLAEEQAAQMANTVPVQLQNGAVVHLPQKMATDLMKQQMANQGKVDAVGKRNEGALDVVGKKGEMAAGLQDDQQTFKAEEAEKDRSLRMWLIKNKPQAAGGISKDGALTPEAKQMVAENYRKTGILPPLGMGAAGTRIEILNQAAKSGAVDIASAGADYKSNVASLSKITTSLDAVTAFENTASKNIDVLLAQAAKIPDTGSPLFSKPLRAIGMQGLGSDEVAAYKAARQVALTEVARVVSNPNLTGVLSDSARQEIAEFNPDSATFEQTVRVAAILKQDMANRKNALVEQRAAIKGRISAPSDGSSGPKVGDVKNWQGHDYKFDGKQWVR